MKHMCGWVCFQHSADVTQPQPVNKKLVTNQSAAWAVNWTKKSDAGIPSSPVRYSFYLKDYRNIQGFIYSLEKLVYGRLVDYFLCSALLITKTDRYATLYADDVKVNTKHETRSDLRMSEWRQEVEQRDYSDKSKPA